MNKKSKAEMIDTINYYVLGGCDRKQVGLTEGQIEQIYQKLGSEEKVAELSNEDYDRIVDDLAEQFCLD